MSPPTGVDAPFSQRDDEFVPYTFDFGRACRDGNGVLYDHVVSAHVDFTSGITVSPQTAGAVAGGAIGTTTVQLLVSGGTAGTPYTVRLLATMASGQVRDLAIQVSFTAKATT